MIDASVIEKVKMPITYDISESVLHVKNLVKSYRKKQVLKGINFSMAAGEIVGILGPNGAGKTTAFYCIIGLVQPDSGSIFLNGVDITHLPMYKRARAGLAYLPQEASIFHNMTVEQNIVSILETQRYLNKIQRKEMLEKLLNDLNITELRFQPAYTLSGGERRRTEIARALATNPKFILLDEPFAGIDPKTVSEIIQIIFLLRDKSVGVLITDHNVRETLSITDRAYIINEGKIVVQGIKEDILNDPTARKVYLGDSFAL